MDVWKVITIIFYAGLALFFFGVAFPYLEVILGICALALCIRSFQ